MQQACTHLRDLLVLSDAVLCHAVASVVGLHERDHKLVCTRAPANTHAHAHTNTHTHAVR